jgi:hypothetical protein
LGNKTVTTTETALTGTFSTKSIKGTVKDGTTPMQTSISLFDGTAATIEAFIKKMDDGEITQITYANTDATGAWETTVLSDVASAYILVMQYTSDYSPADCYITKNKVTLTAGTPINLDIRELNYLGVFSNN